MKHKGEGSCRSTSFLYGQNRNFTSHAPTDTYSHTHARTCTHTHTHARTHARTHTHTHTHTRTHTNRDHHAVPCMSVLTPKNPKIKKAVNPGLCCHGAESS